MHSTPVYNLKNMDNYCELMDIVRDVYGQDKNKCKPKTLFEQSMKLQQNTLNINGELMETDEQPMKTNDYF